MRAVRLISPGKPLEMQDVPVPAVGPHDARVRVKAAGICRSDLHYRTGLSPVKPLPLTLGHEVAGLVDEVGADVANVKPGDRVSIHYVISCGECEACRKGREQFCERYAMIGKSRDGGFADFITVPARNCFLLPDTIPFEHGAILMCSSATAFHALSRAEIVPGDRVAVFGLGGLGMSAIQLARVFGAAEVFAVDIDDAKLGLAHQLGATPIDNRLAAAVSDILAHTAGRGVDVALEFLGHPVTVRQAIDCLAPGGRAVLVGLTNKTVELDPYLSLIGKEAKLIGVNDHLARELPVLLDLAAGRRGAKPLLDLSAVVTQTIPLDAAAVNAALDSLESFRPGTIRTVIVP